jgi:uncharacterized protein YecE (DUF72 family)
LAWRKAGLDVYCYFDNDEQGYATQDAKRLMGRVVSREARAALGAPT